MSEWPIGQRSTIPFQRSEIVFREGRLFNFDIVNPLSKSNEGEAEALFLLFVWLGVLYLSVTGW